MTIPGSISCPMPRDDSQRILLAHGEGARLSRRLIRDEIAPALVDLGLQGTVDAAVLPEVGGPIVMTTDSFVVTPLFFPGGDIGLLAVHGTINDLAVMGATPLYLSLALILEEGLAIETLRRVIESIRAAALASKVAIVTGDTKVVPQGVADQIFVNTTGIGRLRPGTAIGPEQVQPGDAILVSGTLGDHGLTILAAREGFAFGGELHSDTAAIHELVEILFSSGIAVRWLRDPTRGGVSAVLHELAETANVTIEISEAALPVSQAVRGACEVLGLDPLFVANEGKLVAVVAVNDRDRALEVLRSHPLGRQAAIIGSIAAADRAEVVLRTTFGNLRVIDEPSGALLPRIC